MSGRGAAGVACARAAPTRPPTNLLPARLAAAPTQGVPALGLVARNDACRMMVPTEEGDRCHFCDGPAMTALRRNFWCQSCLSKVIGWLIPRVRGDDNAGRVASPLLQRRACGRELATFHQWYHALSERRNWTKFVVLLLWGRSRADYRNIKDNENWIAFLGSVAVYSLGQEFAP